MGQGEQSSLAAEQHLNAPSLPIWRIRCGIWGVLNATPDSFSDGGRFMARAAGLAHAERLLNEGATVIDVGGESSRPAGRTYGSGALSVDADEESARVLPIIEGLVTELSATVSIDTVKAEVARRAVDAGATIVNDVSCGRSAELLDVVAKSGVELVLMHTRGRGEVNAENTRYGDVVADVVAELLTAVQRAVGRGVAREKVWIDPGLGFAKTAEQSLVLLAATASMVATGQRVLVGPSRKSFIASLAPDHDGKLPDHAAREGGTAAAVTFAVLGGAHAVRVHDVATMRQAVTLAERARVAEVRS